MLRAYITAMVVAVNLGDNDYKRELWFQNQIKECSDCVEEFLESQKSCNSSWSKANT